jgi:hypothetical protein
MRVQNAVSASAAQFAGPHTWPALHTSGAVHVPHDATVRLVPQASVSVTVPQFLPTREQNAVSVSEAHPQTLVALHAWGAVHVPHTATVREAPQLSFAVADPQALPSRVQKVASLSGAQVAPPPPLVPPPPAMPALPPCGPDPPVPAAPPEPRGTAESVLEQLAIKPNAAVKAAATKKN